MISSEVLSEIKRRLQAAFGDRFHGVVLYGSEARGNAREDSDIDLLMLLEGPIKLGRDIDIGVESLYPIILRLGRTIEAIPVDVQSYEAGQTYFYREAKREGILA
jgi:uncharacterized protein